MSDTRYETRPQTASARRWTRRKGWPTAIGAVLGAGGVAALAVGGFAVGATFSDGGFVGQGDADFHGRGHAVVSEKSNPADDVFGLAHTSRISITPADPAKPLFVGLTTPQELDRYLSGVAYETGRAAPEHQVAYTEHPGSAPPKPPAQAGIWSVQSSGTGTQTLRFDVKTQNGDRVLVAMNADGSPSVAEHVATADTAPSLRWIGGGILVGGVLLVAGGAMTIFRSPSRSGRPAAVAAGQEVT